MRQERTTLGFAKRVRRNIAAAVLTLFVLTLNNGFVGAAFVQSAASLFTKSAPSPMLLIAPEVGKITDQFKGSDGPTVVCIQDLHCNKEVQGNIFRILTSLKDSYGSKMNTVFVEGSWGDLDAQCIKVIPNRFGIQDNVINDLITRGIMTGAEKYVTQGDTSAHLFGIENEALYKRDSRELIASLGVRSDALTAINLVRKKVAQRKKAVFSKQLLAFEATVAKYQAGKISLAKYCSALKQYSKECGIVFDIEYPNLAKVRALTELRMRLGKIEAIQKEAKDVEARIASKLSKEETTHLATLKKEGDSRYYLYLAHVLKAKRVRIGEGYALLTGYFSYLEALLSLNQMSLVDEERVLRQRIISILAQTQEQKEVVDADKALDLIANFVNNAVTSKETVEFLAQEQQVFQTLITWTNRYDADIAWNAHMIHCIPALQQAVNMMKSFYQLAAERNTVLIQNTLNKHADISVMVVGGYHSEGITQQLRAQNISYMLITPNITQKSDNALYEQRIKAQAGIVGAVPQSTQTGAQTLALISFLQPPAHAVPPAPVHAGEEGAAAVVPAPQVVAPPVGAAAIVAMIQALRAAQLQAAQLNVFFTEMARSMGAAADERLISVQREEGRADGAVTGVEFTIPELVRLSDLQLENTGGISFSDGKLTISVAEALVRTGRDAAEGVERREEGRAVVAVGGEADALMGIRGLRALIDALGLAEPPATLAALAEAIHERVADTTTVRMNVGPSDFGDGDLEVEEFKNALAAGRGVDGAVLEALGLTLENIATCTAVELAKALNTILGMPNFYTHIEGDVVLSLEIQPLLTQARAGRQQLGTTQLRLLNEALLRASYGRGIRREDTSFVNMSFRVIPGATQPIGFVRLVVDGEEMWVTTEWDLAALKLDRIGDGDFDRGVFAGHEERERAIRLDAANERDRAELEKARGVVADLPAGLQEAAAQMMVRHNRAIEGNPDDTELAEMHLRNARLLQSMRGEDGAVTLDAAREALMTLAGPLAVLHAAERGVNFEEAGAMQAHLTSEALGAMSEGADNELIVIEAQGMAFAQVVAEIRARAGDPATVAMRNKRIIVRGDIVEFTRADATTDAITRVERLVNSVVTNGGMCSFLVGQASVNAAAAPGTDAAVRSRFVGLMEAKAIVRAQYVPGFGRLLLAPGEAVSSALYARAQEVFGPVYKQYNAGRFMDVYINAMAVLSMETDEEFARFLQTHYGVRIAKDVIMVLREGIGADGTIVGLATSVTGETAPAILQAVPIRQWVITLPNEAAQQFAIFSDIRRAAAVGGVDEVSVEGVQVTAMTTQVLIVFNGQEITPAVRGGVAVQFRPVLALEEMSLVSLVMWNVRRGMHAVSAAVWTAFGTTVHDVLVPFAQQRRGTNPALTQRDREAVAALASAA